MQEGKNLILCEGSMKNVVNRDTFTVFAYTMFNFFSSSGYKKMLVAFLGNRLHHKLSSDLLKRC